MHLNRRACFTLRTLSRICLQASSCQRCACPHPMQCRFFPRVPRFCVQRDCKGHIASEGLTRRLFVQDNVDFEQFHSGMRWEQKWCCMTGNYTHRLAAHQHMFYVQPTPLTQQPRLPWSIPVYTAPEACDPGHNVPLRVEDDPVVRSIWQSRNHPCIYFRAHDRPVLPQAWTREISLLQLPVDRGHGWAAFKVPGDKADWLHANIAADGRGAVYI